HKAGGWRIWSYRIKITVRIVFEKLGGFDAKTPVRCNGRGFLFVLFTYLVYFPMLYVILLIYEDFRSRSRHAKKITTDI
ncbi:MAG: hypothetical protein U9N37_04145, partial [Thermodesulfobacteriota bacterium]|nr:hypothetical protein [Thermodesulfobacteriota bacterium]